MFQYVLNGLGNDRAAGRLLNSGMDPSVLRPWAETNRQGQLTGNTYITVQNRRPDGSAVLNDKGHPTYRNELVRNSPAYLRREDWLRIDERVNFAAKQRLRFWGDIYGTNPYNIPNGMGTIAVQHAVAVGDASATISMDPIRQGERSRPTLDIAQLPLPVTHSDGSFTMREIAVSRNSGMPLDTTNIELAARKVGEETEKMSLGLSASYTYAGGTIYGATNFPQRYTKVMTLPTAGGWTGATLVAEILDMMQTLRLGFYFGPYVAYYSNAWEPYFGADYGVYYAKALRSRLGELSPGDGSGISAWRNLDYLTGFQILLVQMTPDVIQGMSGMNVTTVQWEEEGGFEWRYKVLCIHVPRIRADGNGHTGIIHGTAA